MYCRCFFFFTIYKLTPSKFSDSAPEPTQENSPGLTQQNIPELTQQNSPGLTQEPPLGRPRKTMSACAESTGT